MSVNVNPQELSVCVFDDDDGAVLDWDTLVLSRKGKNIVVACEGEDQARVIPLEDVEISLP